MNTCLRPIRSTILFGLFCAIGFIPIISVMPIWIPKPLMVWCCLAGYCVLLSRWAVQPLKNLVLPLLMMAALMLLANQAIAYPILLAAFCWIRSGLCMQQSFIKGVIKEVLIGCGGGLLLFRLAPHSLFGWSLSIWLFFLVQSLYFLFPNSETRLAEFHLVQTDPFDHSRQLAERILTGSA